MHSFACMVWLSILLKVVISKLMYTSADMRIANRAGGSAHFYPVALWELPASCKFAAQFSNSVARKHSRAVAALNCIACNVIRFRYVAV